MVLIAYGRVEQGTPIVWGPTGGTGVTKAWNVDALANGSAWQGDYADLGPNWAREFIVILWVETGTAPAASNTFDVFFLCSHDGTNWPAKGNGADGSYTPGTSDANLRQAGPPVISVVATADANTVLRQNAVLWRPAGRYVSPVGKNALGQAVRDQATNSNNGTRLFLIPLPDRFDDT